MKVKYLFILLIVTAFLSSYISGSNKLEEGQKAPAIELINDSSVNTKLISTGRYTLINFWSPKNPASRISNIGFNKLFSESPQLSVEYISICTDNDEALMHEVMKIDGVSESNNISFSEVNERVFKDYGVEEKPGSFLIGPDGKIMTLSPSVEKISELI